MTVNVPSAVFLQVTGVHGIWEACMVQAGGFCPPENGSITEDEESHMARGKVKIYVGTGHGKTPAAVGLALIKASEGGHAVIIQFFQGRGLSDSEFIHKLEPEVKLFRFEKSNILWKDMDEEQRRIEAANIRNGLNYARKVLDTGESDILVMDDVLGLIDNGIITFEEMGELLEHREDTDVVLTGTRMDDGLCKYADEIQEITAVPFRCFREDESNICN
jgi:cob(I)alamin adenosyltransferase